MTPEELKGYIGKDTAGNDYWFNPKHGVFTCVLDGELTAGVGESKEEAKAAAWAKYRRRLKSIDNGN